MKWRLYRAIMRIAHRFHWCYMQPKPQIDRDYLRFRCDWCGASKSEYIGTPTITADKSTPRAE